MYGYGGFGYGGFGYDTSRVKPDQQHSELYQLAAKGDVKGVTDLVEKIEDPRKTAKCINHSRHWTEVDYKASGFAKTYGWNDKTPVCVAAWTGHTDVLKYLLMKHADPTLEACYGESAYITTEQAAKSYLDKLSKQVMTLGTQTSSPPYWLIPLQGETPEEKAEEIYLSFKRAQCNVSLIEEALKFWERSCDAHPRADCRTRVFTNKPKNGLEEALQAVKIPVLGDDPKEADEIAMITRSFIREEEYLATKRDENQKKLNQELELKKNQQRDPGGSTKDDSDDIPLRPTKKPRRERKRLPQHEYESRVAALLKTGKLDDICTLTPEHRANGHKICDCFVLKARRERMKNVYLSTPCTTSLDTTPRQAFFPKATRKKPSWQWTCQLCQYEMKLDRKATHCASCGGAKEATLDDPLNEKKKTDCENLIKT